MTSLAFKKILLIDDDADCIKPLRKILTLNKYQVNVASNGLNGLELQDCVKFDLIITDLKMDGMSGLDVINAVNNKFPDTPMLVISGFINDEEFQNISSCKNLCGVYQKPIDFDEIINKIREIVK